MECKNCGKKLEGSGKPKGFCKYSCYENWAKWNKTPNCKCPICGKEFYLKPSRIKSCKNGVTCSRECSAKLKSIYFSGEGNHQFGLKGAKNSSWISDEKISYYGYKLIRKLDHPFKNSDGFVFEHRLVAAEYLLNEQNKINIDGKDYLSPDYHVHHIDFAVCS